MTKLEEIARALHRAYHGNTIEGLSGGSAEAAWDRDAAYGGNDEWLAQARAAVEVLREPSDAQLLAMYNAMLVASGLPLVRDLLGRTARSMLTAEWQAAVDAILGEADKS